MSDEINQLVGTVNRFVIDRVLYLPARRYRLSPGLCSGRPSGLGLPNFCRALQACQGISRAALDPSCTEFLD